MKNIKSVRNSRKIFDFGDFFLKSQCLSKFSKLLILVKTLNKKSTLVKNFENLNFYQVLENFDFCEKKLKITILVKILKNLAL